MRLSIDRDASSEGRLVLRESAPPSTLPLTIIGATLLLLGAGLVTATYTVLSPEVRLNNGASARLLLLGFAAAFLLLGLLVVWRLIQRRREVRPTLAVLDARARALVLAHGSEDSPHTARVPLDEFEEVAVAQKPGSSGGEARPRHVVGLAKKDGAFWELARFDEAEKAEKLRRELAAALPPGGDKERPDDEERPRARGHGTRLQVLRGAQRTLVRWKRPPAVVGPLLAALLGLDIAAVVLIIGAASGDGGWLRPVVIALASLWAGGMALIAVTSLRKHQEVEVSKKAIRSKVRGGLLKGREKATALGQLHAILFNLGDDLSSTGVFLLRRREHERLSKLWRGEVSGFQVLDLIGMLRQVHLVYTLGLTVFEQIELEQVLQEEAKRLGSADAK